MTTPRTYAEGIRDAATLCHNYANTLPTYGRLAYIQCGNLILRSLGTAADLSATVAETRVEREAERAGGLSPGAFSEGAEPTAGSAAVSQEV